MRKFLGLATSGMDLGDQADVVSRVYDAVDKIEAETGAPLDPSNERGFEMLQKEIEVPIPRQSSTPNPAK